MPGTSLLSSAALELAVFVLLVGPEAVTGLKLVVEPSAVLQAEFSLVDECAHGAVLLIVVYYVLVTLLVVGSVRVGQLLDFFLSVVVSQTVVKIPGFLHDALC